MPVRLWLFVCVVLLIAGALGGAWLMVRLTPEPIPSAPEAARLAEAELLRAQGLLVAEKATRAQLEAQPADLREEGEKVRRASPGAVITSAGQVTTGPTEAKPAPLPTWYRVPTLKMPVLAPDRPCLLREGDPTDIAAEWTGLETEKGNRVLVGRAWAIRLGPGKPEAIITARIKADASRYLVAPARSGWGIGGTASLLPDRVTFGALFSPPPLIRGKWKREHFFGVGGQWGRNSLGGWACFGVLWRRWS